MSSHTQTHLVSIFVDMLISPSHAWKQEQNTDGNDEVSMAVAIDGILARQVGSAMIVGDAFVLFIAFLWKRDRSFLNWTDREPNEIDCHWSR